MASILRVAKVVVQTSGGNYASWTDLNNPLNTDKENYAYCIFGASTSQNHTPAPLTFTKCSFDFH